MSYIGRDLRAGAFRQLDDISSGFDGSDTTHTMQVNSTNVSVGDVNQILLSLGGVIQKPGTDFTVSGSTLTFTTAPASGLSFFAILLGSDNGGTVTPTDASVTTGKIAADAITSAKIADDAVTGDHIASSGAFAIGAAGTASSIAGITFYVNGDDDSSSMYTHDVSGTDNLARGNTSFGIGALDAVTTGDNITAIGNGALSASNTGVENTAIGKAAMNVSTTASYNVAVGNNAGAAMTEGDTYNVFVGHTAGSSVTTGDYNTFLGAIAGGSVTTGAQNTLIGRYAGGGFDTENHNLAIGRNALGGSVAGGEYNVGIGNYTLAAVTSGDGNTSIGYASGNDITTAAYNTLLGYNAGGLINTGSNNVCLGTDAGDTITTGIKNIVIGQNAAVYANDSDKGIVIGYDLAAYATNTHITMGTGSGNDRIWVAYHTNATWARVSDERYKENIKPNTDCGLDFINDLNPVTFTWKAKADIDPSLPDYDETKLKPSYDKKLYGLIAQDVKQAMDKHGIEDFGGWAIEEKNGIQSVAQGMFIHPLIKAVQELSAKVKDLEDKI